MKKDDLMRRIKHENPTLTLIAIRAVLDAQRQVAEDCVVRGETFKISGVVSITPRLRKARMGRNPASGETVEIPEQVALLCRAPASLKACAGH